MTAQAPSPGTLRIVQPAIFAGQRICNIFHFARSDTDTTPFEEADALGAASDFWDNWTTHIVPHLNNEYVAQPTEVTDLSSDTAFKGTFGTTAVSAVGGLPLPSNAAMCVSWKQQQRYRGGHPRSYIAGIPQGFLADARHFQAAVVTDYTAFFQTFYDTGLSGLNFYELRRTVNHVVLPVPQRNFITGLSINARVDSQRRRLGRV
jgi:hypothetical protein